MKRSMTRDLYGSMVQAFREKPGNIRWCAEKAGVDKRTAKRGWEIGFSWATEESGARRPIREVIAEEQEIARVRLLEEQALAAKREAEAEVGRVRERRQKAAIQATDSRVQEAQMIQFARGATTSLLMTLEKLTVGVAQIGEQVQRSLTKLGQSKEDLSPAQTSALTRLINSLTTSMRQANDAASRAIEMERLLLGEPTQVIGLAAVSDDITQEEAEVRIRNAQSALERAKVMGAALQEKPKMPALPAPVQETQPAPTPVPSAELVAAAIPVAPSPLQAPVPNSPGSTAPAQPVNTAASIVPSLVIRSIPIVN